uniref:Uncharacterized protein n=1 Tax=Anopheles epiroticus TaxID=199890 RepID=A0A182P7Y7_9DIPT
MLLLLSLNNAFKFFVIPKTLEEIRYEELRQILLQQLDQKRIRFVESIKFRNIRQQKEIPPTFKESFDIAINMETTHKITREVGTVSYVLC